MTRDEIEVLKAILDEAMSYDEDEICLTYDEAVLLTDFFTKLLEQEPCEDCISREELKKWLDMNVSFGGALRKLELFDRLDKELPSVTPQQKVGKWIMKHRSRNEIKHYTGQDEMGETHTISVLERYEVDEPYCSECGKLAGDTENNYCCYCGAKMQEVEE